MARKAKSKAKKQDNHKAVILAMFFCGLFAVLFGVFEGLVFKSTATYTGASGTFSMDPITSILFILGGLVGIGFAIWSWFTQPKS